MWLTSMSLLFKQWDNISQADIEKKPADSLATYYWRVC